MQENRYSVGRNMIKEGRQEWKVHTRRETANRNASSTKRLPEDKGVRKGRSPEDQNGGESSGKGPSGTESRN